MKSLTQALFHTSKEDPTKKDQVHLSIFFNSGLHWVFTWVRPVTQASIYEDPGLRLQLSPKADVSHLKHDVSHVQLEQVARKKRIGERVPRTSDLASAWSRTKREGGS
ncbi:hypothetical protein ACLB2K_069318 [Fragaria x ananassa]